MKNIMVSSAIAATLFAGQVLAQRQPRGPRVPRQPRNIPAPTPQPMPDVAYGSIGKAKFNLKTYSYSMKKIHNHPRHTKAILTITGRRGRLIRQEELRGEWNYAGNSIGMVYQQGQIQNFGIAKNGKLWHFFINENDQQERLGMLGVPRHGLALAKVIDVARVPVPVQFRNAYDWNFMAIVEDVHGNQWCRSRFVNWRGHQTFPRLNTGWGTAKFCYSQFVPKPSAPAPNPPTPRPQPRPCQAQCTSSETIK